MYQPMEWGSYVSWQLDPRIKVFVDSRIDFFPDEVWTDYVSIGTRRDATLATLDRYAVNLVLWNPGLSEALPATLEASPNWQRVYEDRSASSLRAEPTRATRRSEASCRPHSVVRGRGRAWRREACPPATSTLAPGTV